MQIAEAPLYICDLDGTLLGSDGALSEFARDALNELLKRIAELWPRVTIVRVSTARAGGLSPRG